MPVLFSRIIIGLTQHSQRSLHFVQRIVLILNYAIDALRAILLSVLAAVLKKCAARIIHLLIL